MYMDGVNLDASVGRPQLFFSRLTFWRPELGDRCLDAQRRFVPPLFIYIFFCLIFYSPFICCANQQSTLFSHQRTFTATEKNRNNEVLRLDPRTPPRPSPRAGHHHPHLSRRIHHCQGRRHYRSSLDCRLDRRLDRRRDSVDDRRQPRRTSIILLVRARVRAAQLLKQDTQSDMDSIQMVSLATVATGIDGTSATSFSFVAPDVSPYSKIYFLQLYVPFIV